MISSQVKYLEDNSKKRREDACALRKVRETRKTLPDNRAQPCLSACPYACAAKSQFCG
jgi:hypothetical protein